MADMEDHPCLVMCNKVYCFIANKSLYVLYGPQGSPLVSVFDNMASTLHM